MATADAASPEARHRVERLGGVEQLRIPIPRSRPARILLILWLAIWTAGIAAALWVWLQERLAATLVFLLFLLVFWLVVAIVLAAQLAGAEILRVAGNALVLSRGVGPLRRAWRYRADRISGLRPCAPEEPAWPRRRGALQQAFTRPETGTVRFECDGATVYFADYVSEAEGRDIAAWLAQRLPATAGDGGQEE
jgi:hypothetical protein